MDRLKNLGQERGIISGMPIFGLHAALTWNIPLSAAKPRTLTSTTKLLTWSWAAWEGSGRATVIEFELDKTPFGMHYGL